MIFYFFLMFVTLRGAVIRIRKWEGQRLRRLRGLRAGADSLSPAHRAADRSDPELTMYIQWRDYFISRLVGWKYRRPQRYSDLMERLDIDCDVWDAPEQLQRHLEQRFSLSAYLAFNVENGL